MKLPYLSFPDLLVHGFGRQIGFRVDPEALVLFRQPLAIFVHAGVRGHDQDLSRTEKKWPLPAEMFTQNSRKSFQRAKDRAMHHHRPFKTGLDLALQPLGFEDLCSRGIVRRHSRLRAVCSRGGALFLHLGGGVRLLVRPLVLGLFLILEVEAHRELEVELDRGALVRAAEAVGNDNINLRSVERAVALVEVEFDVRVVQRLRQLVLGDLPLLLGADGLFWSCGKQDGELQPEHIVDVLHEFQRALDLLRDLVGTAEDVRVVLLESPDARQPAQRARELVSGRDYEIEKLLRGRIVGGRRNGELLWARNNSFRRVKNVFLFANRSRHRHADEGERCAWVV